MHSSSSRYLAHYTRFDVRGPQVGSAYRSSNTHGLLCYNSPMKSGPGGVLKVTLPLPPSINNQYATVNGRRVLSADARRFKAEVSRIMTDMSYSGNLTPEVCEALRSGYLSLFI